MANVQPRPVGDMRRNDQDALEEIRRLFARYREAARHGRVTERDDSAITRTVERRFDEDGPPRG